MNPARHARKSLGQNFLVDPNQQRRIVAAVEPTPQDTVLEIGPGRGALTRHLAAAAGRLILVELDDALAADLAAEFAAESNVRVIHDDFMRLEPHDLADDPHTLKVVGNIPYNITTPIIFRVLERDFRPRCIVLMIQREVADRILAPAGSAQYGALSVGVRTVARVERLFHVGRHSFRPVPRVDSTVIRIEPLRPLPLTAAEESDLRTLTRVSFSWRRKQLQKTLRASTGYDLETADIAQLETSTGVSLEQRPEQLDPERFVLLSRALRGMGRPWPVPDVSTS